LLPLFAAPPAIFATRHAGRYFRISLDTIFDSRFDCLPPIFFRDDADAFAIAIDTPADIVSPRRFRSRCATELSLSPSDAPSRRDALSFTPLPPPHYYSRRRRRQHFFAAFTPRHAIFFAAFTRRGFLFHDDFRRFSLLRFFRHFAALIFERHADCFRQLRYAISFFFLLPCRLLAELPLLRHAISPPFDIDLPPPLLLFAIFAFITPPITPPIVIAVSIFRLRRHLFRCHFIFAIICFTPPAITIAADFAATLIILFSYAAIFIVSPISPPIRRQLIVYFRCLRRHAFTPTLLFRDFIFITPAILLSLTPLSMSAFAFSLFSPDAITPRRAP
jgi:hypothetical protein